MNARILLAFLTTIALATVTGAQTKASGTVVCAKPDAQHTVEIADRPGHMFMLYKSKCTWSKPMEIAGTQSKEGEITGFDEVSGNAARGRGYYTETMANGDKVHYRFQTTSTLKDGQLQTVDNKWTLTRGAGKFKGAKGEGTCKGKGGAEGSTTWECEGEYTFPK